MKKASIKYFLLFILATVIAACVFVPIPYYIEKPGSTIDLKQLVTVNGNEDKESGSFSLTSVGVQQATVLTALKSKFNSFEQLVSEEEMFGGSSGEEYDQIQRYYMQSSQNNAVEQALKQAGHPYDFEYKGVYVMSVEPKSNFYHEISVGDTVTQVDGKHFENNQEFIDYVQNKKVDDEVMITFIHEGKQEQATGKLIELSTKKPGIGITLVDHTEIESEDKIDFHVENIGGPSAGLMFTLEIYEQLTKQDLRKGKKIAGTGTINSDGEVGRIGGIDKKVVSADQEGTEIFFAPDDELTAEEKTAYPDLQSNYEEAKATAEKIHSKMKIVPVKTLQDALDYLENM